MRWALLATVLIASVPVVGLGCSQPKETAVPSATTIPAATIEALATATDCDRIYEAYEAVSRQALYFGLLGPPSVDHDRIYYQLAQPARELRQLGANEGCLYGRDWDYP